MARLTQNEIEQILAQQMPGYTVVPESLNTGAAPAVKGTPDAVTPPIGTPLGASDAAGNGEEYTMVLVQPPQQDAVQKSNPGPKAIVISNTTKQIIGTQG